MVFVLLLSFAEKSTAQRDYNMHKGNQMWRHWFVKAHAGAAMLYADASTYNADIFYKMRYESNIAYSLEAGKWLTSWGGAQASFSMGKLYSQTSNTESFTEFNQYSGSLIFNLNQLIYPAASETELYVYAKLGYGFINFSGVMLQKETQDTIGRVGNYAGFEKPVTEWFIPVGIGGVYNINEHFGISLDFSINFTNADKLDASYSNTKDMPNDLYTFLSAGFIYTFDLKDSKGVYWRPRSKRGTKWR